MLAELERHPHARAVLAPALHAGARLRTPICSTARAGRASGRWPVRSPPSCWPRARPTPTAPAPACFSGAHPDLTWVVPSGAHEILVSDIDGPVIAAASKTPFESSRRVFVIERADELGDEAANRMLKTLEEPAGVRPPHPAHRSARRGAADDPLALPGRCASRRPSEDELARRAGERRRRGRDTALACVRLALRDADRARELAGRGRAALRAAAERFARAAIAGEMARRAVDGAAGGGPQARGEPPAAELEARAARPSWS